MTKSRNRFALLTLILSGMLLACNSSQALVFMYTPTPIAAANDFAIYMVKAGDTFSGVAHQFNLTVEQLIALNVDRYPSLARDPSTLKVGWELRVPNPSQTAAPRASQTAEATSTHVDLALTARLLTEAINVARAGRNLVPLREDAALKNMSNDRSVDMVQREYFSHHDPQTGQEPFLRYLQASKYTYRLAGENIAELKNDAGWVPPLLTVAARYTPAELSDEFARGWLNSKEHRENIFNGAYRRTGVSLAVSRDGRRIVATQVFSD
jgi:uncharacterized protein YkwD